jgi:hypothetical protein
MPEPFWCDPAAIQFKISPHFDLEGEVGGDWDIERRHALEPNVKHRAIWQRFAEGARWEDTELFRVNYARRFAGQGLVRGEANIEALLAQYYTRVDGLFADLRKSGFRTGPKIPLPVLLIGRGGEIFIGNQGNHRLAMAQVLGLKRFAGRVLCRHPLSRR